MAKLKESVNSSIFFALKNSETSGVPCLLCGNPGCGKSTTVELFAKIRGYDIVVLRGSTMSETEVMGFDAVNQKKDSVETQHCRPTWYTRLLESSAKPRTIKPIHIDYRTEELLTANGLGEYLKAVKGV